MDTHNSSVLVGRIAGPYGIKGWLKVTSFTEPHDNILSYTPWQLCLSRDGSRQTTTEVVTGKAHGKGLVVKLEGVEDRDAADALRGLEIRINREQMPAPEDGQFYWTDLEGLRVSLADGTEVGTVDHLIDTGSADVMVITGKTRVLVPFIFGETVTNVDLDGGSLTVDWDIEQEGDS